VFGRSVTLFRLLGFEVKVDLSWIIIALIVTWSLARGLFPYYVRGLAADTYWWMGVVGAVIFFASIVFHELCHSLVARRFGVRIRGITLFIFGGVAQIEEDPASPGAEFWMAAAGPASSIFLGLVFISLWSIGRLSWPRPVLGIVGYLGFINLVLAAFNLLPAFPLDGGRVFRSILWHARGDLRWATRIASQFGAGFGLLLIFAGVISIVFGSLFGGLWWILIGFFLRSASRSSYETLLRQRALRGEPVSRMMRPDPVTVASSTTVKVLVEDYIYRHHFAMFPVVEGDRLVGCISTRQLRTVPRDDWEQVKVGEIMEDCTQGKSIGPDTDALEVLQLMRRSNNTRLLVVDGGRLVGIVTLKDLLSFIAVRLELDGGEEAAKTE
jgi:Zn-dependent protease/CBS domain-containing protein